MAFAASTTATVHRRSGAASALPFTANSPRARGHRKRHCDGRCVNRGLLRGDQCHVAASIMTVGSSSTYAGLDHHFITDRALEISDLDTGVHPGWRTHHSPPSFNELLPPWSRRLRRVHATAFRRRDGDSHFYGRGTAECSCNRPEVIPTFINRASDTFFHVDPARPGRARPLSTIQRSTARGAQQPPGDANHRYMIDRSAISWRRCSPILTIEAHFAGRRRDAASALQARSD